MKDACLFDLTRARKGEAMGTRLPDQLVEEYLFVPPQVKSSFLVATLQVLTLFPHHAHVTLSSHRKKLMEAEGPSESSRQIVESDAPSAVLKSSVIIFTSSVKT
jgi:hypothetical protein